MKVETIVIAALVVGLGVGGWLLYQKLGQSTPSAPSARERDPSFGEEFATVTGAVSGAVGSIAGLFGSGGSSSQKSR